MVSFFTMRQSCGNKNPNLEKPEMPKHIDVQQSCGNPAAIIPRSRKGPENFPRQSCGNPAVILRPPFFICAVFLGSLKSKFFS